MVTARAKVKKCLICEQRPAKTGSPYCKPCSEQIQAEHRRSQAEKPVKFLTYKGHVVGMFRNGNGKLTPRLLKKDPEKLPKCHTINLNTYQPGFSRESIKSFKRTVLALATVRIKN